MNGRPLEVKCRLELTTVVLQNYSGDRLRVVQQIKVHLARSGFVVEAPIQVQKAAPAKLLIGTDILPQLGYLFIQSTMEGEDINLLRSKCNSSSDEQEDVSETQPEVIGNCDTEETTNVASGSDCSQVLNADLHDNLSEVVGAVHLIQATKLPARHRKMVRTQVAGASSEACELILFEPNLSELEEKCLLAPEILTSIYH